MRSRVLQVPVAVAFLMGCASPALSSPTMTSLEDCLPGLWVRSVSSCDCSVVMSPECGASDCQQAQTAWHVETGGVMREFRLRYSGGESGTLSVLDAPSVGHWAVVSEGQLDRAFGATPNVGPASCSAAAATWSGIAFVRADSRLALALEGAWSGESTVGLAY